MRWNPFLYVAILVFIVPSALCDDVGYVFKENGGYFLANATISHYDSSEIVSSTTAGSGTPCSSGNTLGWLQNTFDQRVEPEQVHNDAVDLVQSEGSCTIDQICYLYDYLTKSWRYIADPRCKDYFQYANETLQHGKKSKPTCAGAGDCDDFAILMASMVESIGGTTRIILAYGPLGGHAYAEVYLGDISKDKSIESNHES
jgi:hypothetical protein